MNLQKSTSITSQTALVFGKPGSGYLEYSVQQVALLGPTLVVAYVAQDYLTNADPVTGEALPEVDVVQLTSADDFDALLAHLNIKENNTYKGIVFAGLAEYMQAVTYKITGGGPASQPQYGAAALNVIFHLRLLRNLVENFYVTVGLRTEDEKAEGETKKQVLRFDVTPAVATALTSELARKFYVVALGDGSRTVQTDPALALAFRAAKPAAPDLRASTEAKSGGLSQEEIAAQAAPTPTTPSRRRRGGKNETT